MPNCDMWDLGCSCHSEYSGKSLGPYDAFYLGHDATTAMEHRLFKGPTVSTIVIQVCKRCLICVLHNPQTHLPEPIEWQQPSPGEDWQIDSSICLHATFSCTELH